MTADFAAPSFGAAREILKEKQGERIMAKERLVVIGGDAAGMSAAMQAKRRKPELEIVVFERSPHTSFSA